MLDRRGRKVRRKVRRLDCGSHVRVVLKYLPQKEGNTEHVPGGHPRPLPGDLTARRCVPTIMSDSVADPRRKPHPSNSLRGQSLVEFALLLPLLLLLVGGIIQYGILISTSHTLTQVGRDLGRWVATQDAADCPGIADGTPSPIAQRAHDIAGETSLLGYEGSPWLDATKFVSYDYAAMPASPPFDQGVEVAWNIVDGTCPPDDSTTAAFVTVRLTHRSPVILPGFGYLPGIGTCDAAGCYLAIQTTAVYRMEPLAPAPSPSPSP
jgi:hypothetical protein